MLISVPSLNPKVTWQSKMMTRKVRPFGAAVALILFTTIAAQDATADSAGVTFSEGEEFTEHTGQELYANVCQACHMDQGQGAVGAGIYPALAKNPNLKTAAYPVQVLLHGLTGMPPVGEMMNDDQVAAVVNYVRTHFGNDFNDGVTPQDVKYAR